MGVRTMLLLITILTFVTIFVLAYLALSTFLPVAGAIDMRRRALDGMVAAGSFSEELSQPFGQRVMSPLTSSAAASLMRFTPRSIRQLVESRLAMAGGFGNMGTDEFLLLGGFLTVALPVITSGLLAFIGIAIPKVLAFSLLALASGVSLPFLLLNRKIAARKLSMQRDLPDVLDLLTVSVEAGLGFDGALSKVAEKMKGALVDEFNRVLQEMRMGIQRREALHAMGLRCAVPDLSLFTSSLVQADQLGVSIGNVLRIQSAGMRDKRRQRAQEKAMKAPVKMMIPMVLFIFPTIFIVLLGPAVIQIIATFSHK